MQINTGRRAHDHSFDPMPLISYKSEPASKIAELGAAIKDIMETPPEMLSAPFTTIRTILGEQILASKDPLVAELLYMKALGEMSSILRSYHHNMAVFKRYTETRHAYETLSGCYPALINTLSTELGNLVVIWDTTGFPDVMGAMALGESLLTQSS